MRLRTYFDKFIHFHAYADQASSHVQRGRFCSLDQPMCIHSNHQAETNGDVLHIKVLNGIAKVPCSYYPCYFNSISLHKNSRTH